LVKLLAFWQVGAFSLSSLFGGVGDLIDRASSSVELCTTTRARETYIYQTCCSSRLSAILAFLLPARISSVAVWRTFSPAICACALGVSAYLCWRLFVIPIRPGRADGPLGPRSRADSYVISIR